MDDKDRDWRIVDDIKHLTVNGLDDVEAEILREAINKINKKQRDEFDKSMKQASKIVASWPRWKREAL